MSTPYEDILFLEEHCMWPGDMNRFPEWVEELVKQRGFQIGIAEVATIHAFRQEIARLRAANAKLLAACRMDEASDFGDWDTLKIVAKEAGLPGDAGITAWRRSFRRSAIAQATEPEKSPPGA